MLQGLIRYILILDISTSINDTVLRSLKPTNNSLVLLTRYKMPNWIYQSLLLEWAIDTVPSSIVIILDLIA